MTNHREIAFFRWKSHTFLIVGWPSDRIRRLIVLAAAVLILGVVAHGAREAFEYDGAKAVVLCAAAFALVAAVRLAGSGRDKPDQLVADIVALPDVLPGIPAPARARISAVWLQRFLN